MTVTAPHQPCNDAGLGSRCFAVVGSGGLADELADQLEALRAGRIDHFGQSVSLDLANQAVHRVEQQSESRNLSLADVARYDGIFVTDEDPGAVDHLNELCLLAGVRLVVVGVRGTAIVLGVYPFGEADNPACHACVSGATPVSSDTRGGHGRAATQRIAAGFAVTLGIPEASTSGTQATRRLHGSSTQGRVHTVDVLRNRDCPVCSRVVGPVRIVHTRNRWASPAGVFEVASETLQQIMHLSDAIVTAATCSACGVLTSQQAGSYMNRRAPEATATEAPCPVCSSGSMRLESRREFTLAELAQRFGSGPAPVRYALLQMASATICFDLSPGVERRPGHWPLVTGAFVAGFGSVAAGIADVGPGLTFMPDEG